MNENSLFWFIGVSVTVLIALISTLVTLFINLSNRIRSGNNEVHERIDQIKDNYVRRVDMDGHLIRLETNIKELRVEMKETSAETNRRLDAIIASLSGKV